MSITQVSGKLAIYGLTQCCAALLSAVLLVLAFPRIDLTILAWVGLVPLLLALAGRRSLGSFILAYGCGVCFFGGVFAWSFQIPGYKIAHHAILGIYLGIYFGIFGLLFNLLGRRLNAVYAYLAAPCIWVVLEYARSNLPILALPWPLLSHSQYTHLPVIQITSLTGAYGVSFLVVLVNATIAVLLQPLFSGTRDRPYGEWRVHWKEKLLLAGLCMTLFAFTFAYGQRSLSQPLPERKVRLSVLQGNIDQEKKRNPDKYAGDIMQRYADLTEKAVQDGPDLIVWPEAATPGMVFKNIMLYSQLQKLIKTHDTHFLIGSSEFPKFQKTSVHQDRPGNTALFFSPMGKVLGQYLKISLLPFGEYIPFEETFPWPEFVYVDTGRNWDIPGNEYTLFEFDGLKFGVVICWENAFPDIFRRFVDNGANFMLNITNEGWFGPSAAPYQFLAMSVFRAVENRVSLARAANTGISCYIDPNGRVVDRVREGGEDIFVSGYLTRNLPTTHEKTFYTRYGDVFIFLNMFVVGGLLIVAFFRGKRPRKIRSGY